MDEKATPRWYVAHTYSGYENKVKTDIEQNAANNNLQDKILEVRIPMINVTERNKDGVEKMVQKKMFPAYVLINMILDNQTWYIVRNTRGVTGFVGPESKPVPLTPKEMEDMGLIAQEQSTSGSPFSIGDEVVVTAGAWKDNDGVVRKINHAEREVTIYVDMFGRETPVVISFDDIKKID